MECEICGSENASKVIIDCFQRSDPVMEYVLCGWCQNRVSEYIKTNISHDGINILWGCGRIGYGEWCSLRDFLREHKIKEVLEFGTGLSTELLVNEGIKVVSCDVFKPHLELFAKLIPMQGMAEFHWYPDYPDTEHLPDFDKLYPGKKWDLVFVDGPQVRPREVKMAMKLSNKFICLHDPNLGEQSFFPNEEWKFVEGHDRYYQKT